MSAEETKSFSKRQTISPTIKKRRLNIALDIEKQRYENEYTTCCSRTGRTDARLIRYGSKFSLSVLVIGVSFYQILNADPCDPLIPWFCSLISGVLSTWINIPTPTPVKPEKA